MTVLLIYVHLPNFMRADFLTSTGRPTLDYFRTSMSPTWVANSSTPAQSASDFRRAFTFPARFFEPQGQVSATEPKIKYGRSTILPAGSAFPTVKRSSRFPHFAIIGT